MKIFIYTIIVCTSVFYSLNTSAQNKINGIITNASSGEILTGANIIIKNSTLGTASDKNGYYEISELDNGEYTLRVSFFGFSTKEKIVTLNGSPIEINFDLEETSIDLDAVVITGTKTENKISNSPVYTKLISKELIAQKSITYIPQLLNQTDASFEMAKDNTVNSFQLGGLGPQYTLFLIDGERIAGETKGAVDLSRIIPSSIERIEIIKGAASTLYGSNAIGGVVNIITRSVSKPFEINAGVTANLYNDPNEEKIKNDNYYYSNFNLSKGKFSSFSNIKINTYSPYDLNKGSGVQGLFTQENEVNFALDQKFIYTISKKFSLTAKATYYQLNRDFMLQGYPDKKSTDLSYHVKGNYYLNNNSKIELSWNSDKNKIYDIISTGVKENEILDYDNLLQNLRFLGNFLLDRKNTLTFGAEYILEEQSSLQNNIEDKKLNSFIVYLQDEFNILENLDLIAGSRADFHSTFGTHITPQTSLLFSPGRFKFRANFGQGFRAPTVKELYTDQFSIPFSPIKLYLNGNPDLEPETSTYLSGSVQYSDKSFDISINYSENHINNLITSDSISNVVMDFTSMPPMPGQIDYIYSNVEKAVIKNININTTIRIIENLSFSASYTYTNPLDKADNSVLPNIRKNNARFNLDFRKNFKKYIFSANLNTNYYGGKEVIDIYVHGEEEKRTYLENFMIWRLTTTHSFENKYTVTLGINNIFNVIDNRPQYFNFTSPGRIFVLGFSINL